MASTSYLTQKQSEPLFQDILWAKPEQKSQAGNLLILGGNSHAISAPSEAFAIAIKQGAGEVKAVMPDKTRTILGKVPPDIELVPSTPSGSFSTKAEQDIKQYISWADSTLFAGDFGRNSETAILLEILASKMPGIQVHTRDSADYFNNTPITLFEREDTLLVISLAQLQKYCMHLNWHKAVSFDMGLEQLCDLLSELTVKYKAHIVVQYFTNIIVAVNGRIVITHLEKEPKVWRLKTASAGAVWWMQNKTQPLEAIATAITQITW
jgi:hypothetical protein